MAIVKFHSLMSLVTRKDSLEINAEKLKEIIAILIKEFPLLEPYFFDEKKIPNKFINFYINDKDIRSLDGFETSLQSEDIITIVLAIAGG